MEKARTTNTLIERVTARNVQVELLTSFFSNTLFVCFCVFSTSLANYCLAEINFKLLNCLYNFDQITRFVCVILAMPTD